MQAFRDHYSSRGYVEVCSPVASSSHFVTSHIYTVSQEVEHLYFYDNFGKHGQIFHNFFTVKFRNELQKRLKLKLPPPFKSGAALSSEK